MDIATGVSTIYSGEENPPVVPVAVGSLTRSLSTSKMIGFKPRIKKGLELKSVNPFFLSCNVTVPRKTNQAKSNGRVL